MNSSEAYKNDKESVEHFQKRVQPKDNGNRNLYQQRNLNLKIADAHKVEKLTDEFIDHLKLSNE